MLSVENTFTYYSGAFPDAVSVNATGPTTTDGTEIIKNMIDNWLFGPSQAIMDKAGLVPDEVVESATASQLLEALARVTATPPGVVVQWMLNDDPAVFGVRAILLQGQGVLVATYPELTANTYVGDSSNPTAPAFFRADDAAGTSRNTTGNYLILPETRGVSPRAIGSVLINGRTKQGPTDRGELQEDEVQGHEHTIELRNVDGTTELNVRNATGGSPGNYTTIGMVSDGTNGTPRTGAETQASTFGTNYAIIY